MQRHAQSVRIELMLTDLIEDFLTNLEVNRGRSFKTSENYRRYMERFYEFAGDIKPAEITGDLVDKYRLWLARYEAKNGGKLKTITQNYHLIALRGFLKFLAKKGIKSLNPSVIELPKFARKQVSFLHFDEVTRLLEAVPDNSPNALRDRAIIELFFSSGLRVSELAGLNRDHVNLDRREFMVRGKGSKDRPIFISVSAAESIKAYLKSRADNFPPLFLNTSRNPGTASNSGDFRRLTTRSIERLIQKYARLAGITKHVTPHTMRHSFATDILMNGADIRAVQSLLGHSNISTTQIYTHITDSNLKEIHEKFHSETDGPKKEA